jgi:predicted ester cyclase
METLFREQHDLSLKNSCVEFMFAYQQKNVEKMLSFCDSEGDIHFVPLGESGKGKINELGKTIWSSLIECFPDIDNTLDAAVKEDDNMIRCQVVIRGTQTKEFAGIPNNGFRFESDHIFIFHLNPDGRIDNIKISWNHEDLIRQLRVPS